MKPIPLKILILFGSIISILFGVWHFFVPDVWDWMLYIDQQATELILAVSAINFFFSLNLILFGIINSALILKNNADTYSVFVVLSANCIVWFSRIILQVMRPQGSINPFLQFGMLVLFTLVFLSFLIPCVFLYKNLKKSLN
jgi:hypothetical protein